MPFKNVCSLVTWKILRSFICFNISENSFTLYPFKFLIRFSLNICVFVTFLPALMILFWNTLATISILPSPLYSCSERKYFQLYSRNCESSIISDNLSILWIVLWFPILSLTYYYHYYLFLDCPYNHSEPIQLHLCFFKK